MKWNSDKSCYISKGKKIFKKGDQLPVSVIAAMGTETVKEYLDRGLIVEDDQRAVLFDQAKELGLKPHHKAGVDKLQTMIDDFNAMATLKREAEFLGIEVSDDVDFAELKKLVDEKKYELDH